VQRSYMIAFGVPAEEQKTSSGLRIARKLEGR
jgi:hypothetical protein